MLEAKELYGRYVVRLSVITGICFPQSASATFAKLYDVRELRHAVGTNFRACTAHKYRLEAWVGCAFVIVSANIATFFGENVRELKFLAKARCAFALFTLRCAQS